MSSGDVSWRTLRAMDDYYQNGPLPTWIGWYMQQLPHWFHASATLYTLITETLIVWMLFLPRKWRIVCFCIVTPFEISIILTANYTFLNYLVLLLGIFLLDDRTIEWLIPSRVRKWLGGTASADSAAVAADEEAKAEQSGFEWRQAIAPARRFVAGVYLGLVFYSASAQLIAMLAPAFPVPLAPVRWLDPFRIANRYGLFAVMTHERYEIEFQGTTRRQDLDRVSISLQTARYSQRAGNLRSLPAALRMEFVVCVARVLAGIPLRSLDRRAFAEERPRRSGTLCEKPICRQAPPSQVRAVIYQYWFTDLKTKRATGNWWRRELLGDYAPALEREPDGKIVILDFPTGRIPQE